MEEGTPGARVVVVDCPSRQYLPALLQSAALKLPEAEAAAREGSTSARLQCIIHLAPTEVCSVWCLLICCLQASKPCLLVQARMA